MLFDLLTVEEHLWFFAMMKGCPSKRVSAEIDRMIQSIGLQDKRCVQTRALSGGMKRKLSVGIALIAGSKVSCLTLKAVFEYWISSDIHVCRVIFFVILLYIE